jgi:hypothetical protein
MDRGHSTYVVAGEVVDRGLREHRVVLKLRLAERRGVAGNDDQLGFSRSKALQSRLVTKGDLSRLHNQSQTAVDRVGSVLRIVRLLAVLYYCW